MAIVQDAWKTYASAGGNNGGVRRPALTLASGSAPLTLDGSAVMESISSSPSQHSRVAVEVARERVYLTPASAASVMREQMEYLMAHAGSSCHPDCPDCTRMEQVKRYLLQPFN